MSLRRQRCPFFTKTYKEIILNILIIEDEILIQQSLKKLISLRGHNVSTSSLGRDAINLISHNEFDRIICDLMLQDISGFDIIEESKAKLGFDGIKNKFIIITAYSSEQVLKQANSYGCKVLNKPFLDINQAINDMLGEI